jgi:antibiotic biosynthesis monooxygenase (ABM) superfamily enzyme
MSQVTVMESHQAPPSRHQTAAMVWLAVVPTLTVLHLLLGDLVGSAPVHLRPPIMATLAVPVVVYVLMPLLVRLHARLAEGGTRR